MSTANILILTALQQETACIARALGLRQDSTRLHAAGEARHARIEIRTIGIAARHLESALPGAEIDYVFMAGLGGALDPSLRVGDIVVDSEVQPFSASLPFRWGRIHTVERILHTPQAKAKLFQATGAVAGDMEQALVRSRLSPAIAFIGIRAISDTAKNALDSALEDWVDDFGRPRTGAILSGLARRPQLIGQLSRLRADSQVAFKRLGEAIVTITDCVMDFDPKRRS